MMVRNSPYFAFLMLFSFVVFVRIGLLFYGFGGLDEGSNQYLLMHGMEEPSFPLGFHFIFRFIGEPFGHSVLFYRCLSMTFIVSSAAALAYSAHTVIGNKAVSYIQFAIIPILFSFMSIRWQSGGVLSYNSVTFAFINYFCATMIMSTRPRFSGSAIWPVLAACLIFVAATGRPPTGVLFLAIYVLMQGWRLAGGAPKRAVLNDVAIFLSTLSVISALFLFFFWDTLKQSVVFFKLFAGSHHPPVKLLTAYLVLSIGFLTGSVARAFAATVVVTWVFRHIALRYRFSLGLKKRGLGFLGGILIVIPFAWSWVSFLHPERLTTDSRFLALSIMVPVVVGSFYITRIRADKFREIIQGVIFDRPYVQIYAICIAALFLWPMGANSGPIQFSLLNMAPAGLLWSMTLYARTRPSKLRHALVLTATLLLGVTAVLNVVMERSLPFGKSEFSVADSVSLSDAGPILSHIRLNDNHNKWLKKLSEELRKRGFDPKLDKIFYAIKGGGALGSIGADSFGPFETWGLDPASAHVYCVQLENAPAENLRQVFVVLTTVLDPITAGCISKRLIGTTVEQFAGPNDPRPKIFGPYNVRKRANISG